MSHQIKSLISGPTASARAAEILESLQIRYEGVSDVIVILEDGTVYSAKGDVGRIEEEAAEERRSLPLEEADTTRYVLSGSAEEWQAFMNVVEHISSALGSGKVVKVYDPATLGAIATSVASTLLTPDFMLCTWRGGELALEGVAGVHLVKYLSAYATQLVLHGVLEEGSRAYEFIDRLMEQVPEALRGAYSAPVTAALIAEGVE